MKKILHITKTIRPGGGPSGYLFNLKTAQKESTDQTFFEVHAETIFNERNNSLKKLPIPRRLRAYVEPLLHILLLLGFKTLRLESLARQPGELICAHIASTAARLLRVKHPNTKLLFMPHGPVSYSEEVMENIRLRFGPTLLEVVYLKILMHLEKRIFQQVDAVVVASQIGTEAYFNHAGICAKKFFEVTSAVPRFSSAPTQSEARQLLGLPLDKKLLVGFFGRYNYDKGYDYFIDEVRIAQEDNSSIYFFSAGTGPLLSPTLTNYTNFGWRTDIHTLIVASDIVVVPNKHTYFDLLPLEALSLSRIVCASAVGGNKKLGQLSPAVFLFDRTPGSLNQLLKCQLAQSPEENARLNEIAKTSYEENFSLQAFVRSHNRLTIEINEYFSHATRYKS